MTDVAGSPSVLPAGDYHGRPTRRLANEHVWLDVLATAGPRIVRLGLTGSSENLLAETPDIGWETPLGRYELFGGHRLWFAPESPDRATVPDSHGLKLRVTDGGVRLEGPPDPATSVVKSIAITLDPLTAALELHHEVSNTGREPIELAPWAITQLPLGGVVHLPQPASVNEHIVRPNRIMVLWPYTSWLDHRLQIDDGECLIRAQPGRPMKVGSYVAAGAVSYTREGMTLTCRFKPVQDQLYPDLGCNVEVYMDDRFAELEILGPVLELNPGSTTTLDERWELERSDSVTGAAHTVSAVRN